MQRCDDILRGFLTSQRWYVNRTDKDAEAPTLLILKTAHRCNSHSSRLRDLCASGTDDHTGASEVVDQKIMPWRYGRDATVIPGNFCSHWLTHGGNWNFDIDEAKYF
jgi:hypothetical protein